MKISEIIMDKYKLRIPPTVYYELLADVVEAEEQEPTTNNDLAHNLCDSCTNIGCEFQSGIVRTECAFYIPPHLEPDNCGNYIIQEPTTKNDLGVDCIDRTELLKAMDTWDKFGNVPNGGLIPLRTPVLQDRYVPYVHYDDMVNCVKGMPSITPQEPFKPMVEIDLYSVIKQKYIEREVLDKIIAELTEKRNILDKEAKANIINPLCGYGLDYALLILDKYKAETEDT